MRKETVVIGGNTYEAGWEPVLRQKTWNGVNLGKWMSEYMGKIPSGAWTRSKNGTGSATNVDESTGREYHKKYVVRVARRRNRQRDTGVRGEQGSLFK